MCQGNDNGQGQARIRGNAQFERLIVRTLVHPESHEHQWCICVTAPGALLQRPGPHWPAAGPGSIEQTLGIRQLWPRCRRPPDSRRSRAWRRSLLYFGFYTAGCFVFHADRIRDVIQADDALFDGRNGYVSPPGPASRLTGGKVDPDSVTVRPGPGDLRRSRRWHARRGGRCVRRRGRRRGGCGRRGRRIRRGRR